MGTAYQIAMSFGYTIVMDLFIIVAIIIGKKMPSWILYGIGVGLTALSLVGNYIGGSIYAGRNTLVCLIVAIIGFILIKLRIDKKSI